MGTENEQTPEQALETDANRQQRPPDEVRAIARAHRLWMPKVKELHDNAVANLDDLSDELVMTFFVVTIFHEWLAFRQYDPNRGGPCGYCVDAAGGTQDAYLESPRFPDRAAVLAHIAECRHNPVARELAAIKRGEHNVMSPAVIAAALEACAASAGSPRFIANAADPESGWEAALRALQWAQLRLAGLQAAMDGTSEELGRYVERSVEMAKVLGEGHDVLHDRYEPMWTGPDPEDENLERPSRPHTHAELVAAMIGELRARDAQEVEKYDALATAQNERQELEDAIKEQADDLLGLQELAPAPELLSRITKQAHEWRTMLANAEIRLDAAGAPETPEGTPIYLRVASRVDALAKRCEEMLTELRWIENAAMTVWQTAIDTVSADPEAVRRQLTYEIRDHARAGIAAADDGSRRLAGRLEDVDLVIDDLEMLEREGKTITMAEIVGRLRRAHSGGGWTRHA